ncbi:5-3 exonuclease, putative [Bodo saltans]|uniref:5-3 exonuclease, putative n=1 Tax=Bodo saltans TaxID=75058 RepID=A0A0S4JAB4_BODSA|nr:5-3 exonuclease, putative [Bodo saltans]|eukprot:CUG87179.1 5-3 exonuclease, putative [Bodo saltans]
MGIPKFAAWLTRKFPDIVTKQCPPLVHGLYIDMNGIIHPCCHSEDDPSVSLRTEDEKIENVWLCVEQLVQSARPTKVLYLAMDGVAPRAKMNQQRARRYMSAVDQYGTTYAPEEHGFSAEERQKAHQELEDARASIKLGLYTDVSISKANSTGGKVDTMPTSPTSLGSMGRNSKSQEGLAAMFPEANVEDLLEDFKHAQPVAGHGAKAKEGDEDPNKFDSNCISPGTLFMTKVAQYVHKRVVDKIASTDALWSGLSVVCSDTSTPGEGEHKLIDFIRAQTSYAHMDSKNMFHTSRGGPKPAHVICGLDADLILLCLSLHLESVYIMRDVKRQGTFNQRGGGRLGKPRRGTSAVDGPHDDDAPLEDTNREEGEEASAAANVAEQVVTAALQTRTKSYEYFFVDLIGDRIVSEMRALCLATNFVVKMPTAFQNVSSSNGFIVRGPTTEEMFQKLNGKGGGDVAKVWSPCGSSFNFKLIDDFVAMASVMGNDFLPRIPSAYCGESAMDNFLEVYVRCVLPYGFLTEGKGEINLRQLGRFLGGYGKMESMLFRQHLVKEKQCEPRDARGAFPTVADHMYRKQYYTTTTIQQSTIAASCKAYIEGLRFVWQYYSCTSEYCSWSWYYPHHHAPFATDLAQLLEDLAWDKKKLPAPPLEVNPPSTFAQLLCILPPSSRKLLPGTLHDLMTNPPSHLEDTFPSEWAVDYAGSNGREHLSTVLLPFANMKALQDAVDDVASGLTADERLRMRNRKYHIWIQGSGVDAATTSAAREFALRGVSDLKADEVEELIQYDYEASLFQVKTVNICKLIDVAPSIDFRPRTYASTLAVSEEITGGGDGEGARTNVVANLKPDRRMRKPKGGRQAEASSTPRRLLLSRGMPLGDFTLAVTAVLFVATLLTGGTVEALEWAIVGVCSFALLAFMGTAQSNTPLASGCRIQRNQTRDAFLDWLCSDCLTLNFMKNDRCFQCRAPADDAASWAIFTGKLPQRPPPYDANHSMQKKKVFRLALQ